MKYVTLKKDVKYPATWPCDLNGLTYTAGQTVPVIPATNQPDWKKQGLYFIATDELVDDCYGILIEIGDYDAC